MSEESDRTGADDSGHPDRSPGRDLGVEYRETPDERLLVYVRGERRAVVAQNRHGYAMLGVRPAIDAPELERYYGLDMALDHVAELLGVDPHELPVPDAGADMGM